MKRLTIAQGLLMLMVVLSACGGSNTEGEASKSNDNTANEEKDNEESNQNENEEETDEEETLKEVGDSLHDSNLQADIELISIAEPNDTLGIDSLDLGFEDIKVLQATNVEGSEAKAMMDELDLGDGFSFVQINYSFENTEDKDLMLNSPIETIVLNTGEQIESFENDLAGNQDHARDIYGNVKDEGTVSLLVEDTDPKDIEEVKVITGNLYEGDTEGGGALAEPESVTYELD